MDTWKRQSILSIVEKLDLNHITLAEAKQYAARCNIVASGNTKKMFIKSLLGQLKRKL